MHSGLTQEHMLVVAMTGNVEHKNGLSEKILVLTAAIDAAHYACSNTGSSGTYN